MFKIGEFSKLAHTSVRMLRHYDQLELLTPEKVDSESSYRYYSAKQLQKVNKVNRLKELGFSLAIIKEMIENPDIEKMAHQTNPAIRLEWLQTLRAFAAIAVLIFHTKDAFSEYPNIQKILGQGFFGVDVFFCLSGYIMCPSCSQKMPSARNGILFLTTRFARIYSGYWPALVLTLAAAAIGLRPITGDWFSSIFLTSAHFDNQFLETAWTLVYELRFYLAIGIFYFFFAANLSIRNISIIATVIILYNLGYYAFAINTVIGGVWPLRSTLNGFFLEFIFGMFIFFINKQNSLKLETCIFFIPASILLLAAGAFHSLFANFEFLRAATYGLASMLILAFFVSLENEPKLHPHSWLVKIGDASYSLYLIHPILLTLLFTSLHRYIPQKYFYTILPIGLVLIVYTSFLWYKFLEKPIFQGISKLISRTLIEKNAQ